MKRILAIFLLGIITISVSAKFRYGPTAGVTFTDMHWKQHLVQNELLTGFNVGIMGELMIPGIGFGIDFAVKYNMRGGRVHFGDQYIWSSQGYGTENMWFHTLQVPVNLRFKWTKMQGIENYIAPIVFGGPVFNFNCAISDLPILEHPGASVALQCGIGAEIYKRYQITAGYSWDMTYDVRTRQLDNFSARVEGWFLNLAVFF